MAQQGCSSWEQVVASWGELARTSIYEMARWARAYADASATYWTETGKVLEELASDVNDAAGKVFKTAAREDATGSLSDAVSRMGQAWARAQARYGEVYQKSVETFVGQRSTSSSELAPAPDPRGAAAPSEACGG